MPITLSSARLRTIVLGGLLAVGALIAAYFMNLLPTSVSLPGVGQVELPSGLNEYVKTEHDAFRQVGSVNVHGTDRFVASGHFVVDTSETATVRIYQMNEDFIVHFLNKVEERIPASDLRMWLYDRGYPPSDKKIISMAGGQYETYLSDLWELLKRQPVAEMGLLQAEPALYNTFYIRDADGFLWSVSVTKVWSENPSDGSWAIRADPIADNDHGMGQRLYFFR